MEVSGAKKVSDVQKCNEGGEPLKNANFGLLGAQSHSVKTSLGMYLNIQYQAKKVYSEESG